MRPVFDRDRIEAVTQLAAHTFVNSVLPLTLTRLPLGSDRPWPQNDRKVQQGGSPAIPVAQVSVTGYKHVRNAADALQFLTKFLG